MLIVKVLHLLSDLPKGRAREVLKQLRHESNMTVILANLKDAGQKPEVNGSPECVGEHQSA
jgi:hypothetical protein